MQRSYAQMCGIARALDAVGDRWTLLVVRELVLGPRRYTDLATSLEGITTNLLADRLARLEALDVVTRRPLPRPGRGHVYVLTELGRRLEPALLALGAFGAALPPDEAVSYRTDPRWAMLSLRRRFRGTGTRFAVNLEVADETFFVAGDPDGELVVSDGTRAEARATLRLSRSAFGAFYRGTPLTTLESSGRASTEGRRGDLRAMARSVGLTL